MVTKRKAPTTRKVSTRSKSRKKAIELEFDNPSDKLILPGYPPVVRNFMAEGERAVFISDVHAPFQSKSCVSLAVAFVNWFQPDIIYMNGDWFDFYQLSRFDKDPARLGRMQEEIDVGVEIAGMFREAAPKARMIFRDGNHELRLQKFLWKNPEITTLRALQLPKLLEFDKFDIEHVSYNGPLWHGDNFLVEHGDSVRQKSAYTANSMLMKRQMSGISGHTHRLGSTYATSTRGTIVWYENGCLCETNPEYILGEPDWQNGFSTMHSIDNRFHVEQVWLANDKLFYHGNLWEVVNDGVAKRTQVV